MYYSLFFKVSSLTLTKFVENVLTIHVQINKIWNTCSLCILTVGYVILLFFSLYTSILKTRLILKRLSGVSFCRI